MTLDDLPKLTDDDWAAMSELERFGFLKAAEQQCVVAVLTPTPDAPGAPGCWFGGKPTLPPDIPWPMFASRHYPYATPMHFIFQINLACFPLALQLPKLPPKGTLFFFFNIIFDVEPWGSIESGARMKLIYVSDDVSTCPTREMPPIPKEVVTKRTPPSIVWDGKTQLEHWNMRFMVDTRISYKPSHGSLKVVDAIYEFNNAAQRALEAKFSTSQVAIKQRVETIFFPPDELTDRTRFEKAIVNGSHDFYGENRDDAGAQSMWRIPIFTGDELPIVQIEYGVEVMESGLYLYASLSNLEKDCEVPIYGVDSQQIR